MSTAEAAPAERLATCLSEGRWNELESIWLENLAHVPSDQSFLWRVAETLVSQGQSARAIALFQVLCPRLRGEGTIGAALPALKKVAPLAQDDPEVRAGLVEAYRAAHKDVSDMESFLRTSGLAVGGSIAQGITAMDRFLRYRVGAFVHHEAAWGVGRILSVNPTLATLLIDFEERKGHTVPIDGADKYLQSLPPDHLLAMRAFDVERLRALAKESPNVVVRKVIEAHRAKINLRDLKAELMPRVIAADEWSSWWASAKAAVKKDPHIEMSGSSVPTFELREVAVSQEDETLERLDNEHDPFKRIQIAYDWLKDAAAAGTKVNAPALVAQFADPDPRDPHGLAIAFLREDLKAISGHDAKGPSAEELLRTSKSAYELMGGVGPDAYLKRTLALWKKIHEDAWGTWFVRLLSEGPEETWDPAVRELCDEGKSELVVRFLEEVLREPERHPDQILWLYRAKANPTSPGVLEQANDALVLRNLLKALDAQAAKVARDPSPEGRKTVQKFRSGVAFKGYAPAKAILEKLERNEAREFYWLAARNRGLSDQAKMLLTSFLESEFVGLIEDRTKVAKKAEDEEVVAVLLVTQEAYKRKYKEFEHLVNVQMLENSQAIGRAMELGDLSENSEYSAALERQQQLAQKAKEMKADLDRAKMIDAAGVKTDSVDIGTRVTLTNLTAQKQETWTILGPWDADPDRGVISYTAALGKTVLGKKPGEEVEFVHETTRDRLRIDHIERAL